MTKPDRKTVTNVNSGSIRTTGRIWYSPPDIIKTTEAGRRTIRKQFYADTGLPLMQRTFLPQQETGSESLPGEKTDFRLCRARPVFRFSRCLLGKAGRVLPVDPGDGSVKGPAEEIRVSSQCIDSQEESASSFGK